MQPKKVKLAYGLYGMQADSYRANSYQVITSYCPKCGYKLYSKTTVFHKYTGKKSEYCPNCGTHIDWSD